MTLIQEEMNTLHSGILYLLSRTIKSSVRGLFPCLEKMDSPLFGIRVRRFRPKKISRLKAK
jgi:hypothetical protein